MKKLLIIIFFLSLIRPLEIKAQCDYNAPKIKFSGVAPYPWSIDGKIKDWETILGKQKGSNEFPYNPPYTSYFNFSEDYDLLDNPSPSSDIRFTAFTYDDYNVYFYLRKLSKLNNPTSIFYFCDVNADGYMNTGEPVFGLNLNSKKEIELNSYWLFPDRALMLNYAPGPPLPYYSPYSAFNSFVDGYSIEGILLERYSNMNIPDGVLKEHEVFSAAETENGYGVEFAVPWSFLGLRPNDIFTYRISLQKSDLSIYNPQLVEDNAGSCFSKLLVSGIPYLNITKSNIIPLIDGLSYQLQVTLQNPTNLVAAARFIDVSFSNIQLKAGLTISPNDFSVISDYGHFLYNEGTILHQPIYYLNQSFLAPVYIPAHSSITFTVIISLPSNHSITRVLVNLGVQDESIAWLPPYLRYWENEGGSKGINPIGFDINTEEGQTGSIKSGSEDQPSDKSISKLKVYPNPSNGSATVLIPENSQHGELRLTDISGKLILRKNNISDSKIKLQDLQPGFYILEFNSKDRGKQYIEKLIVQ